MQRSSRCSARCATSSPATRSPRSHHARAPAAARDHGRQLGGLVCLAAATAILLAAPDAAIPGMILLVAALLLVLPLALSTMLALVTRLARGVTAAVPHIAVMELSAAGARAVAIAATGAIAIFGSVAIQGAHGDLLKGLENAAHDTNAFTDLWVSPAGSYNLLNTAPFAPVDRAKLEHVTGVRACVCTAAALLDYGERRMLVIAPPRQATPLLPADPARGRQPATGDRTRARRRLAGPLPSGRQRTPPAHRPGVHAAHPQPDELRIAALSTNLGWAPGAIIMNAADYARAWGTTRRERLQHPAAAGVSPVGARRRVETRPRPALGLRRSRPPHSTRRVRARSAARPSRASPRSRR